MGHNGCDGSQASGPWAIGSGYRFTPAAPRALSFLLEIVIYKAAKFAGHGKALFSSVREAIGMLK